MTSITVMLVVHFGKSFVHYSEREEAYKQRKWEEKVNRKKKVWYDNHRDHRADSLLLIVASSQRYTGWPKKVSHWWLMIMRFI